MVTQRQPRRGGSAPIFRGTRLLLAFVLFMGEGSWAYAARDLWSDRRRAVRSARTNPTPDPRHSSRDRLVAAFPTIEKGAPLPMAGPAARSSLPHWLESAVGFYADVGESHLPTKGERRVLIHIQDLHDVEEAQRNIAAVLDQLAGSLGGTRGLLVGLEGAAGGFRTADYRALASPPILRRVSERFLKAGILSGPEFFSLTTPQSFRLWGVEDAPAYVANIRALTDTFPQQAKDDRIVARAFSPVEKLKDQFYPAALKELDRVRTQYDNGEVGLVAYVQKLSQGAPSEWVGPTLRLFLEAVAQERDLSLKEVANDQSRLLETLAPLLNDAELKQLVDTGLAQRMGRVSFSRFYGLLRQICKNHKVSMERYPSLVAHAAYGVKSEGIDPSLLLRDVDQLAHRAIQSHLTTPLLVELSSLNEDVRLVEKLNRFVLVPEDFRRLVHRRAEIKQWNKRGAGLGGGIPSSAWPDLGPVMERHEKFYLQAERRNRPLVQNLIAQWNDSSPAVLVAGGYHTEGVRAAALSEGLGYISLVPRVSSVDHFPPPLESFRTKGKQSEWVFRGEVSGLQRQLFTAEESPGVENSAQTAVQRLSLFASAAAAEIVKSVAVERNPRGEAFISHLNFALQEMAAAAEKLGIKLRFRVENVGNSASGDRMVIMRYSITDRQDSEREPVRGSISVALETGEFRVRTEAPVGLEKFILYFGFQGANAKAYGLIHGILERASLWGVQIVYALGRSSRTTAVFLVRPFKSLSIPWLSDSVNRWIKYLHLGEYRRVVAVARSLPWGIQSVMLWRVAAAYRFPYPEGLNEPLLEAINHFVLSSGRSDIAVQSHQVDDNNLTVNLIIGRQPVQIKFGVSYALPLIENPGIHTPYQMEAPSQSVFHVLLQMPPVPTPGILPTAVAGVLNEISGLAAGQSLSEARENAFTPGDLQRLMRSYWQCQMPSGAAIDPEILEELRRRENALPQLRERLISAQDLGNPQNPIDFTEGAAPVSERSDVYLGLWNTFFGDYSVSGHIQGLKIFSQYLESRGALFNLFPTFGNKRQLLQLTSDLVNNRLAVVGMENGWHSALTNSTVRSEEALAKSAWEDFLPFAQSLMGFMSVSGVSFKGIDPNDSAQLINRMFGVYEANFKEGFRQARIETASAPSELSNFSGVVLHWTGSKDQAIQQCLKNLMEHTNPINFNMMVLKEGDDVDTQGIIERLISGLAENYADSPNYPAAVQALRSGRQVVFRNAGDFRVDGAISMEGVLKEIQSTWREVSSVGVFSSRPDAFAKDVKDSLLSWALIDGNGRVVSQAVEDAVFKQAIQLFILRQA